MLKKSILEAVEFSEERFTKRIVFREGESTSFVLNFNPGQELPSHTHPGTEVFILVLEGSGTVNVNGIQEMVSKNDALLLNGSEEFSIKNTSNERTSLYVILSKIPNEDYAKNI